MEALRLGNLIAAHAIAYLDRFLNNLTASASVNLTVNLADKIRLCLDSKSKNSRVLCGSAAGLTDHEMLTCRPAQSQQWNSSTLQQLACRLQ